MSEPIRVRRAMVGANHAVIVRVVACISRIVRRSRSLLVDRRISIRICSIVSDMLWVLLGGVFALVW